MENDDPWKDEDDPGELELARRIAERLAVLAIEGGNGKRIADVLVAWTDYKSKHDWYPPWSLAHKALSEDE